MEERSDGHPLVNIEMPLKRRFSRAGKVKQSQALSNYRCPGID
jgi:hypothetical protein